MSKNTAIVIVVAIIGVTVIPLTALATGHNSVIVTGSTSAIVGMASGFSLYYRGKTVERKTVDQIKAAEKAEKASATQSSRD